MIVIDRSNCIGCGACSTMTLTFPCIEKRGELEFYEEPPKQDRDYVLKVMRECWSHCIGLSGGTWEDDE